MLKNKLEGFERDFTFVMNEVYRAGNNFWGETQQQIANLNPVI